MSKKLPNVPLPKEFLNEHNVHDLSKARDARCIPVAQEIIRMIALQEDIPMGSHANDEVARKHYVETIKKTMQLFIDKGIMIADQAYVFNLVREAVQYIQEGLEMTFDTYMNKVTEAVYGLDEGKAHEISVANLEQVVKHAEKIKDNWKKVISE
jgi:hypothetical protein